MKNKKASLNFSVGTVLAIFLFGFLALVFFGGLGKMWEVIGVLKQIPAWVWVIVLVLFVFKRWGK